MMPIKAENRSLYLGGSPTSREWMALRKHILKRAENKCERCKVPNGSFILRSDTGKSFYLEALIGCGEGTVYDADNGVVLEENLPWYDFDAGDNIVVKVVLTIAHLDQNPTNNAGYNLKALCQRCHNRHDMPHRQKNAAVTRRARLADGDLFS